MSNSGLRAARATFAAVLVVVGTSLVASSQLPAASATVAGRVIADATEQPVRRAWVVVRATDGDAVRVGATDLNGEFRFDGLPPGRYRVGASKRPYLAAVIVASDSPVVLRLTMGAAVYGLVTELGKPVREARILLSGPATAPTPATTDSRGEYRIHGLPAGEYQLTSSRSMQPRTVTLVAGATVEALPIELQEAPADATPVPPPANDGSASVGGRVLDATTGQPLSGIQVSFTRAGSVTTSDSDGRFRFERVRAGTYGVMAQHPEYSALSSATVAVVEGASISDVVLRIGRHATVSGSVRDDAGDPVVGMPVMVFRRAVASLRVVSVKAPAFTNERGAYRVDGLLPGEYVICACPDKPLELDQGLVAALELPGARVEKVATAIEATVLMVAPTYFPGTSRVIDAHVVTINHGDERPGLDITLHMVKPVIVSGLLTEDGGPPAKPMALALSPDEGDADSVVVSFREPIPALPDGTFRLVGIPPGRYSLTAFPSDNSRTPTGSLPVIVEERDLGGLILPVREPPAVRGRIEFSGRSSPPDAAALAKATISLLPAGRYAVQHAFNAANPGDTGNGVTPDSGGRFTIPRVFAGRYYVSVRIPGSNWRTVSRLMTAEAGMNLDGLLTVGPNGADDLLVTVSDDPLASLEGTAVLDKYQTPNGVRVAAFPADKSLWPDALKYPARFVFVFLTANRTFRFEAMPPGEYFVALAPGGVFELSLDDMQRWSQTAQRVRLRGGETTTLELRR